MNTIRLLRNMFRNILPFVETELEYWNRRAMEIPNEELRKQALASLSSKKFHCQGGAVFALLSGNNQHEAIRFIVAYQTICDYLDNLCDSSTSSDPKDFELLHIALRNALSPQHGQKVNYYALREDQDDNGYLDELVSTCQSVLDKALYQSIQSDVIYLEELYSELQIHKHVKEDERIIRLKEWHEKHSSGLPWHEFSAASGSTIGIFCLVSYCLGDRGNVINDKQRIFDAYFPNIQALHILLDYYIDQDEDLREGELNFCTYYSNSKELTNRFDNFIKQSFVQVNNLPDQSFHELIIQGMVALYMADRKVDIISGGKVFKKHIFQTSGFRTKFIYSNIKTYYRLA